MRVVGLVAPCDINQHVAPLPLELECRPSNPGWSRYLGVDGSRHDGSASFDAAEFAALDDGRPVPLHEERGFTIGGGSSHDPWSGLTEEILEQNVRTPVLPDDDETEDEHPYEWLADLCRLRGLRATAEHLRRVPYVVELSERVIQRLAPQAPSAG